jgi:hypothetical protein
MAASNTPSPQGMAGEAVLALGETAIDSYFSLWRNSLVKRFAPAHLRQRIPRYQVSAALRSPLRPYSQRHCCMRKRTIGVKRTVLERRHSENPSRYLPEWSALPRLPRSGFILRSPKRVSRKREFSWIRLETFESSRPKKCERPSLETLCDGKSPHLAGLSGN